jgi:hypothetical protein
MQNLRCDFHILTSDFFLRKKTLILTLSHFNAALLFSIFASTVFGITQRETPRNQFRYGLYCFAMFMGGLIVAGWLMWVLRH